MHAACDLSTPQAFFRNLTHAELDIRTVSLAERKRSPSELSASRASETRPQLRKFGHKPSRPNDYPRGSRQAFINIADDLTEAPQFEAPEMKIV